MDEQIKMMRGIIAVCYGAGMLALIIAAVSSDQWAVKGAAVAAIILFSFAAYAARRYVRLSIMGIKLKKDADHVYKYRLRRHDWMNDLQLIFAYVKMKKLDKLLGCVENIQKKLEQEGQLLRLGLPFVEQSLLAFASKHPDVPIDVKADERLLSERADEAAVALAKYSDVIEAFLRQCDLAASNAEEQSSRRVKLSIQLGSSEQADYFELALKTNFNLAPMAEYIERLGRNRRGLMKTHEIANGEHTLVMRLHFPYQTLAG